MRNELQKAFDQITASEPQKEAVLAYLAQQRHRNSRRRRPTVFVRAFAAAAILIVLCLAVHLYLVRATAYTVRIDASPVMELKLNHYDNVISASAATPEENQLLQELSIEGMPCQDAISLLLNTEPFCSALTDDSQVPVTVDSNDSEKETDVCTQIQKQVRKRQGRQKGKGH